MPVRTARKALLRLASRRSASRQHAFKFARRLGLAVSLVLIGCENLQSALADGDTRTISMRNVHTNENATVTFKRNGRYDDEALKKLNHVLRDWRRNEEIAMDPRLIDLVWEAQRDLNNKEEIQIICGYRAPATNAMLRRRSEGVARFSQHTLGKAMDFYIPGAPLEALREVGLRLQRGGVGFYPTSGSPFVHLDVGSVRHWPRMTHDQLARVFPDGKTVHIPSDGKPLAGYAVALADVEKRGGSPSSVSLEAARSGGISATDKRGLFAKLFSFGKSKDKDEDEDADVTASVKPIAVARSRPVQTESLKPGPAPAVAAPTTLAAVPMPKVRPEVKPVPVQVAAVSATMPLPKRGYALASADPANIFDARGYWQGRPEGTAEPALAASSKTGPTSVQLAAAKRQPDNVAARDASTTGVAGPGTERIDRVPGEIALAYAAQAELGEAPARTPNPMGTATTQNFAAAAATIAVKGGADQSSYLQTLPIKAASATGVSERGHDPWLRAIVMAPNLQGFLTTTLLGPPDYRALRPLLERPSSTIVMTFSEDPHHGMSADSFGGSAVIFLATATFSRQTAALR